MMNPKDRCKTCNGKKINSERKVLEVHIDKGMKSGQQIKFAGESDQSPGVEPGDVVIVLEEKEHARFQRKGDDLFCEAEVDLLTALGGGEFLVQHLDERYLHVTIVPGEVIKPSKSYISLTSLFAWNKTIYHSYIFHRLRFMLTSQTPSKSSPTKVCPHTGITRWATSTSVSP